MAYDSTKFGIYSPSSIVDKSSVQWKYEDPTGDTLTAMMMTGFFDTNATSNNKAALLEKDHLIFLVASDGSLWVRITQVTPSVISTPQSITAELPNNDIFVGDSNNEATAVAMSGRVNIDNTGNTTLPCTSAQVLLGNASNTAIPQPLSGRVNVDNSGTTTLVVAQDQIIVGDVSGKGQPVAMSGRVNIDNTGLTTLPLTDTQILVGNGSNLGSPVSMSGDTTIDNSGSVTIANSAITGPKTSAGKFYSTVSVITNGTTPVNVFGGGGAPTDITITGFSGVSIDAGTSTITLKNGASTVATFDKVTTLNAFRGAISYSNTSVSASTSVTVESASTDNVVVYITFTSP